MSGHIINPFVFGVDAECSVTHNTLTDGLDVDVITGGIAGSRGGLDRYDTDKFDVSGLLFEDAAQGGRGLVGSIPQLDIVEIRIP